MVLIPDRGATATESRWRSDAGRTLLLWALWSAGVLAVAAVIARTTTPAMQPWPESLASQAPPLARWDSGWYYEIAAHGYPKDLGRAQSAVGFYPLYPLLARWIARSTRLPIFPAGIALSLASLAAAMLLLESDRPAPPKRALFALLFYPGALFFAAFYTESFFLLATVLAFVAARRGRWIIAGIAAAAACAARFNGIAILPALAWLAWDARRRDGPEDDALRVTSIAIAVSGAVAFPLFQWRAYGDPFAYVHNKVSGWPGYALGRFWAPFANLYRTAPRIVLAPETGGTRSLVVGAIALVFVLATLAWCRSRKRYAELIYTGSFLLLILGSATLDGLYRYAAATFPCFLAAGDWLGRSRKALAAYVAAGAVSMAYLVYRFVRWKYVG